ncbi:MAG: J domain-containing protein [Acidimicrobiales bacterium]|nr:J domain-containing protein [Acidimicrobiales bacterium]
MADRRTHYEVLKVERDATSEQLRAAYLRQARRHHPDTAGSDLSAISEAEREMRSINAAWEVLSDPEARRRYDLTLPVPERPGVNMGAPDGDQGGEPEWDHDAIADAPGVPIGGVAKVFVRAAPIAFVAGMLLIFVSAVMQNSGLWRLGLATLVGSLVAFLLAPFFVMASSHGRD